MKTTLDPLHMRPVILMEMPVEGEIDLLPTRMKAQNEKCALICNVEACTLSRPKRKYTDAERKVRWL